LTNGSPLFDLYIWASEPYRKLRAAAKKPIPQPIIIKALIDTGASCTCINETDLSKLGLPARGTTLIHTPSTGGTPATVLQYDVSLMLAHLPSLGFKYFSTVPVIATDFSSRPFKALIGRDVLKECLLVYDGGAGIFSLAF
jgi:predicted aspartyl protease